MRQMAKPAGHVLRPGRAVGKPALPLVQAGGALAVPRLWRGGGGQVRRLARGLAGLGVTPGDRVVLVAENRPEWAIADLAIMAAGAITVPAYTTNTPSDHRHVLTHSGAKGVIVSTRAMAERVLPAALEAPELGFIVAIEELRDGPAHRQAGDLLGGGLAAAPAEAESIELLAARLTRADVACFIYTSGTGGTPKGVMLTHGSILCQLPRRLSPAEGARARRRGLPLLPAAVARL